MENLKEELLKTLDKLKNSEYDKFKWFLEQDGIPVARLEKAERQDAVDLMVQKYGSADAIEKTKLVLEKISRVDLVESLEEDLETFDEDYDDD